MSLRAMLWVLDVEAAHITNASDRLLAAYLADYADGDGLGIYPSVPKLAERAGVDRSTVFRGLKRLRDDGVLERVGERDSGVIEYRLIMPPMPPSQNATGGSQGGSQSRTQGGRTGATQTNNRTDGRTETRASARARGNGDKRDRAAAQTQRERDRATQGRADRILVLKLLPEFVEDGHVDDYAVWAVGLLRTANPSREPTGAEIRVKRDDLLGRRITEPLPPEQPDQGDA